MRFLRASFGRPFERTRCYLTIISTPMQAGRYPTFTRPIDDVVSGGDIPTFNRPIDDAVSGGDIS